MKQKDSILQTMQSSGAIFRRSPLVMLSALLTLVLTAAVGLAQPVSASAQDRAPLTANAAAVTRGSTLDAAAATGVAETASAPQDYASRVSNIVERVAPVNEIQHMSLDKSTLAADGNQRFTVSSIAASGVTFATGDGSRDFSLGLPNASSLGGAQTGADGTIVYRGSNGNPDVAVQALSDGLRIQTVTVDSTSPKSFNYGLSADTRAVLNKDGSVDVLKSYGQTLVIVGHIDAPWAKDANGKAVPTRFLVSSRAITQTIAPDASAAYPIVADPKTTSTWWNTTIYFNRYETKIAAIGGGMAGTVASWVPTPYTIVVGRAVQLYSATFGLYYARGACAKLVFFPIITVPVPIQYSGSEAGGYCR